MRFVECEDRLDVCGPERARLARGRRDRALADHLPSVEPHQPLPARFRERLLRREQRDDLARRHERGEIEERVFVERLDGGERTHLGGIPAGAAPGEREVRVRPDQRVPDRRVQHGHARLRSIRAVYLPSGVPTDLASTPGRARARASPRGLTRAERQRYTPRLPEAQEGARGSRIHLHDARRAQGGSPGPGDPRRDHPVLPPRREDRRARRERRRQEQPAAHHGGHRHGFPRRGAAGRGHPRRLPPAGAAARPGQGRARQRRRGRGRDARAAAPLRGALARSSPSRSRTTR